MRRPPQPQALANVNRQPWLELVRLGQNLPADATDLQIAEALVAWSKSWAAPYHWHIPAIAWGCEFCEDNGLWMQIQDSRDALARPSGCDGCGRIACEQCNGDVVRQCDGCKRHFCDDCCQMDECPRELCGNTELCKNCLPNEAEPCVECQQQLAAAEVKA